MSRRSLAQRVDAILTAHQDRPTSGFTVNATCPACGGTLTVTRTEQARQTRRAHTSCAGCDQQWEIKVSITKPGVDRTVFDGPRLPWAPLARHLPRRPADIAERLAMSVDDVTGYRDNGIPAVLADGYACLAGVNPVSVWGDAYRFACDGMEAVA